jgi:hypothetical protein
MLWEFVFMMVILKIPIVYLCFVVWWAVKAEPRPPAEAVLIPAVPEIEPRPPWRPTRSPRRPRNGPRRSPERRSARVRA